MSLTENSNQLFLPGAGGGATNSQNSPYISVWPLHYQYVFDDPSNTDHGHCKYPGPEVIKLFSYSS